MEECRCCFSFPPFPRAEKGVVRRRDSRVTFFFFLIGEKVIPLLFFLFPLSGKKRERKGNPFRRDLCPIG